MKGKTHWKKLFNPNYLGAYSIEDDKDLILTIKQVRQEEVMGADGKKDECMVCYFTNAGKPMILNTTNAKTLAKLLKTPYIEEWAGHQIQVGKERVKAFGEIVEALRVRNFKPETTPVIKCEDCKKDIIAANNMTAEQLSKYTMSKYKRKLCAACATIQAQAKTASIQDKGQADEANKA